MVRHILLLQPRPGASSQAVDECRRALTSLVGRIPGLLSCHWGENLAAPERRDGFTHGFSMDFADAESLATYGPHPEHRPAAALVRATFDRIVAFDFVIRPG